MNDSDYNPFELATKLTLYQLNDAVMYNVVNISKAKTLVHVDKLCRQIENYQRMASFVLCCYPSNERSRKLEHICNGINECYNELEKLAKKTIMDKAIERYANMCR